VSLTSHYDEIWSELGVPAYLASLYPALEQIGLGRGTKVLDIACGNGALGEWLIPRYGCEMYGIDISTVALEACRKIGYRTEIVDVDSTQLPFEGVQFDMVALSAVLEHVMEPDRLLKQAFDVLKPGGHVVVLTPNVSWIVNRLLFLLGRWDHKLMGGTRGHISYMNRRQLGGRMAEAGFAEQDWSHSVMCVAGNSPTSRTGLTGAVIRALSNRRARWWPSLLAFNFIVVGQKPLTAAQPNDAGRRAAAA
jgi:2-polyprenyl-3-methyl-5-hydroxy-6-metoxy-1,4-benzoquinol methylase